VREKVSKYRAKHANHVRFQTCQRVATFVQSRVDFQISLNMLQQYSFRLVNARVTSKVGNGIKYLRQEK
jgi:hypothetical protein